MEFKRQFSLSEMTTFRLGGPAEYFCSVKTVTELREALQFGRDHHLPILILGNGSNVLISDQGFPGLVIQNRLTGLVIEPSGRAKIGAGENWDDVTALAVKNNLAGIECLSGIPGSAGGGIVQNIGAYGQTLGDVVISVQAIEVATGDEKIFSRSDCNFAYRQSRFKQYPSDYVVTGFEIQLTAAGQPTLNYGPVAEHFAARVPTLQELRDFIIKTRAAKGYLIMPGYESYQTAGSFFKNPIVDAKTFENLKSILGGPELHRYWPDGDKFKLAAAFLMQEAGYGKSYRAGNVGISPKHALSLTNYGGGTAAAIKALAEQIKKTVREKFGVQLEEEVLYIGNF